MSTDLYDSFNEQYTNINTKLKKRFMRKPNILEATNEFLALAIQCEHSEQPSFAGQCYVGAAKCEATAGNYLAEADHYLSAARQYMQAETKLRSLKFYSNERENLEAASGCYIQALSKYPDKSPLRTSILMELAAHLLKLDYKLEALHYYQQAVDQVEERMLKIMCLRKLVNLLVDCGKLESALKTANQMVDGNLQVPEDILSEIQVTRVLLSLLLDIPDSEKTQSLNQVFYELLNDNDEEDQTFHIDLKLKLQSIVYSIATSDTNSLIRTAAETRPFLTFQQKEILQKLIVKEEQK